MNVWDIFDRCGYLLGRHLDGPTNVTVERVSFNEIDEAVELHLVEFKRRFVPDPDDLAFCEYAGLHLQLHPRGDDIWIA